MGVAPSRPVRIRRAVALVALLGGVTGCRPQAEPISAPAPTRLTFDATAYSIEGTTADGTRAREGIVAADPRVLPLGSHIRVAGAGGYDGVYVVEDTGRAIKGHEIDLYLRNDAEAKRFGRKRVHVQVLRWGQGRDGKAETP
jgi:3D (Asp-Asp-Asp) domain-containing protein